MKRWLLLALPACLTLATGLEKAAAAMTYEERQALDLSAYRVVDTHAGYFDVPARKAYLASTGDPVLTGEIARLRVADHCDAALTSEPFAGDAPMTMLYDDRSSWQEQVTRFHRFEDAISGLSAAQLLSSTSENGACAITAIDRWAQAGAFLSFDRKISGLQTWFQIESTLFAMAFSYAIVRDEVPGMSEEKARIERWLGEAARTHLAYAGGAGGTCCNNHFYRRAVHAAMIGVITGNDDLFRFGISAVYSAVADATPDGALRLEMQRGDRAAHYQNYATMYLAFIAQIAARQGYDLYQINIGGRSLDTIIAYTLATNADPSVVAAHSGEPRQKTWFLKDDQYFSWLELAARRPQHRAAALSQLEAMRPTYNRSLGGYATLYFMEPQP